MAVSQEALTILLPLYMLDSGASPAFAPLIVGLRGGGVLLFDVTAGMHVAFSLMISLRAGWARR